MLTAFLPVVDRWTRFRAGILSVMRALGARFSTALIGTWSTRQAVFELVPRDMHTSDPTRAVEWMEGYIALSNGVVELKGRNLFEITCPSESFACELHSFEWIRHLRAYRLASTSQAESNKLAAATARAQVLNWIATRKRHPKFAYEPLIAARRALSLTNHAAFLLDDAEPADYRLIMTAILNDVRFAHTRRATIFDPTDQCLLAIACASVAFSLTEHVALKQKTHAALAIALKAAFLADGGPLTRRVGDLPHLLANMLALGALFDARGIKPPSRFHQTIQNAMRVMRMQRHPNGSLARFQGTTRLANAETDLVASVLFFDTERGPLPITAPESAFTRLEAEKSVVLVDCGSPPPPLASRQSHASCLAFEWSYGAVKIITSAAELGYTVDADIRDQRRTVAHSTVVVGGVSSATLLDDRIDSVLANPALKVSFEREDIAPTRAMRATHTGYRAKFGCDHARALALSDNGRVLEGRDRLMQPSGQPVVRSRATCSIYFQLQPGTRIRREGERRLRLMARQLSIVFEADAGSVELEDPTDRPTYRGPHRALRLVVHAPPNGPADIKWRFIVQVASAFDAPLPSS